MAKKVEKVAIGVDIDGDGKPDFSLDIKTIGMFVVMVSTVIGMWFTLKADIQEAKELPVPPIERMEFDMKDELIRQTIMDTQKDVEAILDELVMKKLLTVVLFFICTLNLYSQEYINDSNFEEKINQKHAFSDDTFSIVIVEFYVEFNKQNAFKEWEQLKGIKYFRADIQHVPEMKKKFRVRMAPTLIIFNQGNKEEVFKAGLDLLCPVTLEELQESITELKTADKF